MDANDKEKYTLPMLETLTEVVNAIRHDMTEIKQEMNFMMQEMNTRFKDARLQLMSVDVRLDRLESMAHEALSIAYNARADVKVLREEVYSWSKDIMALKS